jgi:hypothetical protein
MNKVNEDMSDNIERIIFNAQYISSGTSLADNAPIKMHKLETLENDISQIANSIPLDNEQKVSLQFLFNTINELKGLSGEVFRGRALSLVGQVKLFLNQLN